eukprot:TRINITY_DN5628_c0_g1_i1.p1 TRINITY_DN5628_c0_g1~~TRINITY_DN5628_c0_g1_i1.p1  ORF type:complete len:377 (+),score=62.68 TRINITY_DN5628_c0_g1_i1:49-1179(+)
MKLWLLLLLPAVFALRVPVRRRPLDPVYAKQRFRDLQQQVPLPARSWNPQDNPIDHLRNIEDVEYLADVTIGTPGQTFTVVMDTGSSNLWVSGSQCTDVGCSKMHKFYASKSSTYVGTNTPFAIQYGTGSCSGKLANDTVSPSVGGPSILSQTFGVATTVAAFFKDAGVDGIWGLGLKALAIDHVAPPLDNMAYQSIISKRLFGVYLNSKPTGSEIHFGFADTSKCSGRMTYFKYQPYLFTTAYYLVHFSGMSVDGQSIDVCNSILGCEGLLDTGTSLIVGPPAKISSLISALNITSDCSNFDNGPTLTIHVGGTRAQATYSIPSNVYTLKDGNQCAPGLQGMQGAPFFILGDTFLRTVYAVFDNDNMQAGLCPQA